MKPFVLTHIQLIKVADVAQYDSCLEEQSCAEENSSGTGIDDRLGRELLYAWIQHPQPIELLPTVLF